MEKPNNDGDKKNIRLNRFLSMAGISSRRKAEELILSGAISVNGNVIIDLATKINAEIDVVKLGNQTLQIKNKQIYILFNKPKDCITTLKDNFGRKTIFDFIKIKERIFPIGRLDRNTTGVLLLTNDGIFANNLMHPSKNITKTYRARIDKSLIEKDKLKLSRGVFIDGGKTSPANILVAENTNSREIFLTIHEGKNRQIHKMFHSLGYEVEKLERINYAGLTAKGLARGEWRILTNFEINQLKNKNESKRI